MREKQGSKDRYVKMARLQYVFPVFIALLLAVVSAFKPHSAHRIGSIALSARKDRERVVPAELIPPKFVPGENIPDEIKRQASIYDMILVERLSAPLQTNSGIFLPTVEGKDRKQMGKVLSVPTYGLESEQGRLQGPGEILPDIKPGDVVFLRDAWGIGPKDQEVGERKFR